MLITNAFHLRPVGSDAMIFSADERECIYVYTMGKVASSSIDKTLKRIGYKTRHFHYFKGDYNSQAESVSSIASLSSLKGESRRIITLTRDPIARNVSAFFQNLGNFLQTKQDKKDIEKIQETFREKYNHKLPINWFDGEFKATTGVDIYQIPFDKVQGYNCIRQGNLHILVMKSEISDGVKVSALARFLGDGNRPLEILKSNDSADKDYSAVYRQILNRIRFNEDFLEEIYSSKYSQHFYTTEELRGFKEKWMAT